MKFDRGATSTGHAFSIFRSGWPEKWAAHESDDVNLSGGKYTKLCHPLLYLDHRQTLYFGVI